MAYEVKNGKVKFTGKEKGINCEVSMKQVKTTSQLQAKKRR
jgi:hypothetical protein